MGLVPNFSESDITKMISDKIALYEKVVLNRLIRIGEQFIKDARSFGDYKDRTGNLRSSIGYVVLKNGEQLTTSGFLQIKDGAEGISTGKKFIEFISLLYPKGYVLIVVAGMNYAAYVEAKGRDVLTSSSVKAQSLLEDAIEKINKKAA